MFVGFQPKSAGRAAFLLLVLASLLAFHYGWFAHATHAIATADFDDSIELEGDPSLQKGNVLNTDWGTKFAIAYSAARAKAVAKKVAPTPWYAGEYVEYLVADMEDTHTESTLITPSNEYFDEIRTCMTNGPISFGTVRDLGEGRLEFCRKTKGQTGASRCGVCFVIPWGQRQYLIWEGQMAGFLSAVASHEEPRNNGVGNFYMRKGDWEKPVEGKPRIPKTK